MSTVENIPHAIDQSPSVQFCFKLTQSILLCKDERVVQLLGNQPQHFIGKVQESFLPDRIHITGRFDGDDDGVCILFLFCL